MSSRNLEGESIKRVEQQLAEQDAQRREILNKLEKKDSGLRFGRPSVSTSSLAEQYFCEKKVEMRFLHGKIDTESKQLGSEAHDKLLAQSVKMNRKKFFNASTLAKWWFLRRCCYFHVIMTSS